jgi:RNA polymerase sigma factor (sigma-70 family)
LDAKGEPAAVRVLLYEIARTTLRQYVARKVKDAREVSDLDNVCLQAIDPQSPGSLARVRRDVRRFIEALREVPLSHQIVLELKYFEGLADHEIAERLDTPESTIRDAIAQGLGRLREQIVAEHRWGVVAPSSVSDADLDKWAAEVRLLRAPGEPS